MGQHGLQLLLSNGLQERGSSLDSPVGGIAWRRAWLGDDRPLHATVLSDFTSALLVMKMFWILGDISSGNRIATTKVTNFFAVLLPRKPMGL